MIKQTTVKPETSFGLRYKYVLMNKVYSTKKYVTFYKISFKFTEKYILHILIYFNKILTDISVDYVYLNVENKNDIISDTTVNEALSMD